MDEAREFIYFARTNGEVGKYDLHSGKKKVVKLDNGKIAAIVRIKDQHLIAVFPDSRIVFLREDDLSVEREVPVLNPTSSSGMMRINEEEDKLLYRQTVLTSIFFR